MTWRPRTAAAEHFGIERLALVVGGSMGAQQAYEWAVRFPDQVLRAAPIAGTARSTPHNFLLAETMREATWWTPAGTAASTCRTPTSKRA